MPITIMQPRADAPSQSQAWINAERCISILFMRIDMANLNIDFSNLKINELKAFAVANDIPVYGNKTFKQNWIAAIESWIELEKECHAVVMEAEDFTAIVDSGAVVAASAVVELATSPTAVKAYKTIFHYAVLAVVLVCIACFRVGRWCWNHRGDTAVAHWLKAPMFRSQRAMFRLMSRRLSDGLESVVMVWMCDRMARFGGPVSWGFD